MDYETSRPGGPGARRSRSRSMSPRVRSHADDSRSNREKVRDRDTSHKHHHSHRDSHKTRYDDDYEKQERSRHRSHHHRDPGSDRRRKELSPVSAAPRVLPYNARHLSKHDLSKLEPMFAMYLDIQKGLAFGDLSEKELRGRWKSFVKKWNHGELAEGWYDPATFEKAASSFEGQRDDPRPDEREPLPTRVSEPPGDSRKDRTDSPKAKSPSETRNREYSNVQGDDDDDDDYGPTLPNQLTTSNNPRSGPTIPNLQDLEIQREYALEDARAARSTAFAEHKEALRSHKDHVRTVQEEVAPRAEPGTHERKMEKRREAAAANREFAAGRRGGSPTMDAAPDSELMGGGEGDLQAMKKAKEQEKKKKNEREIRREEIMRAKQAEREERLAEYKKKEEETMGWLKALAKQRFG